MYTYNMFEALIACVLWTADELQMAVTVPDRVMKAYSML